MTRIIWKAAAAAIMAMCCLGARAGTQTGTVTSLEVRASDGLIAVYLSGTASGRPACAVTQPYWIVKDENSTSGKQQLAQLMLARATGQTVTINGMNTCVRWSDGEDINLIIM